MEIYVVRPGDSLYSIARSYGVSMSVLMADNQLPDPGRLVAGQTIVVRRPGRTYTVQRGDTLSSIARREETTVRSLLQNNPALRGEQEIFPGQILVLSYAGQEPAGEILVTGYAYPFADKGLLQRTLPYLSALAPFSYGIRPDGTLVEPEDRPLIAAAEQMGVTPVMHLSTLTDHGSFDNELAHLVLTDTRVQDTLTARVAAVMAQKGYRGLDVDFEYLLPEDARPYAAFLSRLRRAVAPMGAPLMVALAPKTSADQSGLLYQGHDYRLLGAEADLALLMTYEWGYAYGPPMAVAPLPEVRRVVEYALTEMPGEKILLGVPNYGYNWPLPFRQGDTRATSLSNQYAVALAGKYGAEISYSESSQAPWYRYRDESGREHEVWFEDARSIRAKLSLVREYGLRGAGYWNLMRPFPQNWVVLSAMYGIQRGL